MSQAAPEGTPNDGAAAAGGNPFMQQQPADEGQSPQGENEGTDDGQQDDGTDWKAEARKHEKRAKDNAAAAKRARELEAELNQYREASQSETEKAINAARREAEQQTAAKYQRQIATAEVRAAAGGKLQDPNDAVRLIDLDEFIAQDGTVDTSGINDAIAQLVKDKPYLGVQQQPARAASFDGGQRQGAAASEGDFNAELRKGFRRK